jgi:hypothetical protein
MIGKKIVMRRFIIFTVPEILYRVIKPRRIRRVGCYTHGRYEKCLQNVGWKTMR